MEILTKIERKSINYNKIRFFLLERGYIEFKYYADAIHSGLTPPG